MIKKLDIDIFLTFKHHPEISSLDGQWVQKINSMFLTSKNNKTKNKNKYNKKPIQLTKNPKFKDLKNKLETKINFILNKLTKKNQTDILLEFCGKIKITSEEDFNNLSLLFWKKMIIHPVFSSLYFNLFIKVIHIYSNVINFEIGLENIIDIIESKFLMDYCNYSSKLCDIITDCIGLPEELTIEERENYLESYKYNNINIIKLLLKNKILNNSIREYITEIFFKNANNSHSVYQWYLK